MWQDLLSIDSNVLIFLCNLTCTHSTWSALLACCMLWSSVFCLTWTWDAMLYSCKGRGTISWWLGYLTFSIYCTGMIIYSNFIQIFFFWTPHGRMIDYSFHLIDMSLPWETQSTELKLVETSQINTPFKYLRSSNYIYYISLVYYYKCICYIIDMIRKS